MRLLPRIPTSFLLVLLAINWSCSKRDPIEDAAINGDTNAQVEWANKLLEENQFEAAHAWLDKSSSAGNAEAAHLLAILKAKGTWSQFSPAEGIAELVDLAAHQHLPSITFLADSYENGVATNLDSSLSIHYFKQAADLGDPYSKYKVALEHWISSKENFDLGTMEEVKSDMFEIGSKFDQRAFGLYARILDEQGRTQRADKYFLKAANAKDPYSMYRTGIAYHRTINDKVYGPLGFKYLEQAVESGVKEAIYPLAKAYYVGNGTPIDREKSLKLTKIAAWSGDKEAIRFLGSNAQLVESSQLDAYLDNAALALQAVEHSVSISGFVLDARPYEPLLAVFSEEQKNHYVSLASGFIQSRQSVRTENMSLDEATAAPNLFTRFEDDEKNVRSALETLDGDLVYEQSLRFLDKEKSYYNLEDGVKWLSEAVIYQSKDAALKQYELYKEDPTGSLISQKEARSSLETYFFTPHATASMYLAQEYKDDNDGDRSDLYALSQARRAFEAGNPNGFQFIKEMMLENRFFDLRYEITHKAVKELAAEGHQKFRFINSAFKIALYINPRESDVDKLWRQTKGFIEKIVGHPEHELSEIGLYDLSDYITPLDLPEEIQEAVSDIVNLAEEGYIPALQTCAAWYLVGGFLNPDLEKANDYYSQLSQASHSINLTRFFAFSFLSGNPVVDIEKGCLLLREAAELGDEESKAYFSDLQGNSPEHISIETSVRSVAELVYQARVLNDPQSMFALAGFFRDNVDLDKSYSHSEYIKWLEAAAEHDNQNALVTGWNIFMSGDGVEADPPKALSFLTRSADLGLASSQFQLALFYFLASGMERDVPKGIRYLLLSEQDGYFPAESLIARLRSTLGGKPLSTVTESDITEHLNAISFGHDFFPTSPFYIKTTPITKLDEATAATLLTGESTYTNQDTVFLASQEFHLARISVLDMVIQQPTTKIKGYTIHSSSTPRVILEIQANSNIEDGLALLAIKSENDKLSFFWTRLPNLSKQKPTKIDFNHTFEQLDPSQVAVYFFADGKEISSNARIQPHHFMEPTASDFITTRDSHLVASGNATLSASLSEGSSTKLPEDLLRLSKASISFRINDLGYVAFAELPESLDEDLRQQIFRILPTLKFLPAMENGKPVYSHLTIDFAN